MISLLSWLGRGYLHARLEVTLFWRSGSRYSSVTYDGSTYLPLIHRLHNARYILIILREGDFSGELSIIDHQVGRPHHNRPRLVPFSDPSFLSSTSTIHRCAPNTLMSLKAIQTSRLTQAYLHQLMNHELRTKVITAGMSDTQLSARKPTHHSLTFRFPQAFWGSSKKSSRDISPGSHLVKSTHPPVRSSTSSRHRK
jgi:hypothetical protein